jgi:integrase
MDAQERRAESGESRAGEANPRQFRLFAPDVEGTADGSVHGTISPMYAPDLYDWAAVAAREVVCVEVPEAERESFAQTTTLRQFWAHPLYGLERARRQHVTDGTLAGASLVKDVQGLNRWERFSPRPGDWPAQRPWLGRPLAWITDQHVTDTLAAMRGELAGQTVRSTWFHLRTIFNRAVEVKALERAPEPAWAKGDAGDRAAAKQAYSDAQLVEIYTALDGQPDLQVAFVVSCNVGPRTVDLFCLRWEDLSLGSDRPTVEYVARKTGKRHRVPLAACTVQQLRRWARHCGLLPLAGASGYGGQVWPDLTDASAGEPEQSRAARRRNARFKGVLATLGIEHAKPWQVGRLTCNERLERHRPGSGQFVLGHANTLNSVSYREPSGMVFEAITTLPQPACFAGGGGS